IGAVLFWFGSLDYATVLERAPGLADATVQLFPGVPWSAMTLICVLLFIGAMGKSAQVPLHVWLPDSMEGPTPISALIHAATMVTAGIFMVARMSPLFELSETALLFVLFIGATTAFFTGLIGIVQNDIKRVVAYSTLSQLGYMTVALGVSAYAGAVYHLMTHAFFKALLFLAAGSVIIGMHHEQDMRRMGGLRRYMPVTYAVTVIGTLALVGFPFFSGYYSKDSIIEAVHHAAAHGGNWVHWYGYLAVLAGVFVTSFYSFRLLYLTFHGEERFRQAAHDAHDDHGHGHGPVEPHESPLVVTVPLVLLAIPSIAIGFLTVGPMLFGGFFADSILVREANDHLGAVGEELFHGALAFGLHFWASPAFWLALAGFLAATLFYLWRPDLPGKARRALDLPYRILVDKYGFDRLWIGGLAGGSLKLGQAFWRGGDVALIDGVLVDGSATLVDRIAALGRRLQSGLLYHYAFAMILGLIALLGALVWNLR